MKTQNLWKHAELTAAFTLGRACSFLLPMTASLTTLTLGGWTAALAKLVILPITVKPLRGGLTLLFLLTKWSKI